MEQPNIRGEGRAGRLDHPDNQNNVQWLLNWCITIKILTMTCILSCFDMTWFQLMLPALDHDVTKILTGHRMHVEGPQ